MTTELVGGTTPLENLLAEDRRFPPTPEFTAQANARAELYLWSAADRLGFWAEQARLLIDWDTPFTEVLDWSGAPVARWFADGRLNACYNAVDRHVEAGNGDRVALLFEGEPGDRREVTYAELQREVCRAANALTARGVGLGDRVAIYLPLIPEAVVAMLACALYTAPTAIRTCMKWGEEIPGGFDLSSLRVLGSVGEPINPEAWMWYRRIIGGDRAPVVDTWWQTETGAIMISPLPGVTATKPGSAMTALPGIAAEVVDEMGDPVPNGSGGYLVLTEPWPAMLRGIWGDQQRFVDTYWSRFPDQYFTGDGAKKDADGDIWLLGRVDDVMNVSGHRLSTAEIESALVSHPMVAEAAVVGASDETTGQAVVAFVILRKEHLDQVAKDGGGADVAAILRRHVTKEIGPIAKPRTILVVTELPKTRSGKIMRRLLRDVAEHRAVGDVTTLADSSVMDMISAGLDARAASADG